MSSNERSIGDILHIEPIYHSDSGEWRTSYSSFDEPQKTHAAVTVALELIKADISASTARTGSASALEKHLNNLGEYAEMIKRALESNA